MTTTAEKKKVISNGRLVIKKKEELFTIVKASELSLDDDFMKYEPVHEAEKEFKEQLEQVIQNGVKDFYRSICDPGLSRYGKVYFKPGLMPAIGNSYEWWERTAKEYSPERSSHLLTKNEYIAFLGVLIKGLVAKGWPKAAAWHAVCVDSTSLGNYANSSKSELKCEETGSREILGFYDLGNVSKILAKEEDSDEILIAGGSWCFDGNLAPIAGISSVNYPDNGRLNAVGIIAFAA